VLWIIDGNNLIHSDPMFRQKMTESGMESAKKLLHSELSRVCGNDHRFQLVMDGGSGGQERAGLEILVARRGQTADDLILSLARNAPFAEQTRIVTNDHSDIGSRIDGGGVIWISCSEFRSLVLKGRKSSKGKSSSSDSGDKPAAPRSKNQVNYWLDQFSEEDES
jgi:predicted RNA-binding protein with PIN domain